MIGKVIRIGAVAAIVGLLFAVIIMSVTSKPSYAEKVWDNRSTLGDAETAEHHFIMYTDIMCPYCDIISRLMINNEAEFIHDYIEEEKVLFEVRMTDFLYEYGAHHTNNSREGAEAVYCAKNEGKFWEYYHAAVMSIWDDYQSQGIGASSTSAPISDDEIDDAYWLEIGREIGLGDDFKNCYLGHEALTELQANTERAANVVDSGLPYLRLDNYVSNGFSPSWGWNELRQQFDTGLKS